MLTSCIAVECDKGKVEVLVLIVNGVKIMFFLAVQ